MVCLPARGVNHAAGKRCTVTGYGYMGESGPIPLRVREAELPIVSDAECIRKVNAVTEKIFILPASSFCAGGNFSFFFFHLFFPYSVFVLFFFVFFSVSLHFDNTIRNISFLTNQFGNALIK